MKLRRHDFQALGGPCSLQLHGDDETRLDQAAAAAQAEVQRIEAKYSRYLDSSLLTRINRAAGSTQRVEIDAETAALLDYAHAAWEQSSGLFDITSGVLRRAWNFRATTPPSAQSVAALLPLIGWQQVERGPGWVRLPRVGMELDFGGFGKEYAADRAAAVLRTQYQHSGLVELGGDVAVTGPQPDGQPWRIGIRHPRQPQIALALIDLSTGGLASSGDYERYLEHAGQRYSHILDPRSGYPVQDLRAVSVAAEQCLIAGTATTIALLKGRKGPAWLRGLGLPWLSVDAQGTVDGSLVAAS